MNDDMLSQEEINALLSGMDDDNDEGEQTEDSSQTKLKVENYLSGIEQDALGEIGNISFGSSATALSTLLNQKVDITTPKVSIISREELDQEFPKPHVAISVQYTAGFEGMNLLVIKTTDAAIIADLMLGYDGKNTSDDLGEMEISAVQEAMNQMMGSASTSMSTIFNKKVDISPPGIDLLDLQENPNKVKLPDEEILVKISFDLKVGDLIDSKIMQLVTVSFAKDMVEQLMNPDQASEEVAIEEEKAVEQDQHQQHENQQAPEHREQAPAPQQQAPRSEPQHLSSGPRPSERSANVQPAAFSNFEAPVLNENEAKNLDMLLDIPLEVTVELGRTKRSIKEILELSQGSIVELDKLAGEPVDILVNHRLIAKGEVVVIDENFGVRVTDIVSQKERIHNLR
ncbi:flagellar motor switch phosphatase FliY [Salipaludibacillus keqinensis]|uniref:Flagellar motor switch phosphatase FliY n=1 Tax=Salipaludibacillus keqinensis TaxID=2045207 RepID=A0A323TFA6_9BACI|nr:flagellar motor switch phosphatase FliY [Salipaludibacillus keqinensis]PYZ93136.1 flagellar motor switch phosphatase FliY [Salipaludibacillus keqinensis]